MATKPAYKIRGSKMRTLVMLSGGIDSTSALWHVLNHPEDYGEVLVHHIHIRNLEARWKAEAIAVKNVLNYMKKHAPTPFSFSQSTVEVPHFGNQFMFDVEAMGFITGYMTSRDTSITKVVIGATKTDFDMGVDGSVMRGKRAHNAYHPDEKDHSARIKEYTQSHMTKEEVYKSVPPELAALTWSCRTPHYADGKAIECGRCKTCKLELTLLKRPKSPAKKRYK